MNIKLKISHYTVKMHAVYDVLNMLTHFYKNSMLSWHSQLTSIKKV